MMTDNLSTLVFKQDQDFDALLATQRAVTGFGEIDLRAHTKIVRARRTDTPR